MAYTMGEDYLFNNPGFSWLFLNACRKKAARGTLTTDFMMGVELIEAHGDIFQYIEASGGYRKFGATKWELNFLLAITELENKEEQQAAYKKMHETLHPSRLTKFLNQVAKSRSIGMACTPF